MSQPGKGFLVWLAGLSVLGFLATDMYLPAFAAMQQDLNTSAASISASLSLFLAGFALGQLFWGPLSDRYGRKPVLLSGLAIFAVGCLGMLWVQNATLMLALRFLQAIGVCAAAVTWQAMVTDYYPAQRTNRIFATIMPLVGPVSYTHLDVYKRQVLYSLWLGANLQAKITRSATPLESALAHAKQIIAAPAV